MKEEGCSYCLLGRTQPGTQQTVLGLDPVPTNNAHLYQRVRNIQIKDDK